MKIKKTDKKELEELAKDYFVSVCCSFDFEKFIDEQEQEDEGNE
jgi:hypothetical protein